MAGGRTGENVAIRVEEVLRGEHVLIHHHPEMELTAKGTVNNFAQKRTAQVGFFRWET